MSGVGDARGRILHVSQRELLLSGWARVIPDADGPAADDLYETPGTVLARPPPAERVRVTERAAHIEEALTSYKAASPVSRTLKISRAA
jgi:hypothetical protein